MCRQLLFPLLCNCVIKGCLFHLGIPFGITDYEKSIF